jgi:crotonobetainyl-CoA:carnitine CoA-transferase CaiB-like acyl-CoA transferase
VAVDVVFSRQRVGADVVFAFQFPVSAAQEVGHGLGIGAWDSRYSEPRKPRRSREDIEAEAAEAAQAQALAEVQRAVEIADAAVARAAQPSKALRDLQSSLRALLKPPPEPEPLQALPLQVTVQTTIVQAPSPAMLDEDAILAASVLMLRRRRK